MSGLSDISIESIGDPLDLFGGQAAKKGQELASETARLNMAESRRQFDAAQANLEPFAEQAVPALQRQAAFSGAQGAEAQGLAFQQFAESPATQFLRESGLNLSTPGQGPEQQKELERYAQGLALQDFGNTFNRLGSVAGTGQTSQFDLAGLGENVAGDIVQQQQNQFSAQQQGLAAQESARANAANVGIGLGTYFSNRPPSQAQAGAPQVGAPISTVDYRGLA